MFVSLETVCGWCAYSTNTDPTSTSANGKRPSRTARGPGSLWQKRQNMVYGAVGLATTVFVGVVVFLKEVKRFNDKLSSIKDVFERENASNPYVYVRKKSWPDEEFDGPKNSKQKRLKRTVHKGVHQVLAGPWFPWLQSHSNDPWTLLRLARSPDRSVRLLGVKALSEQHHWNDAEYLYVAQACDMRSLIGLARSRSASPKLFLPPPKLPPTQETVEDGLRQLLSSLPLDNIDRCTAYFTSSALQEGKMPSEERGGLWCFGGNGLAFTESISRVPMETVEVFSLQALARHSREGVWSFDGQGLMRPQPPAEPDSPDGRILTFCLEALFSHSCVAGHCPQIAHLGGLQILQRIYENRPRSVKLLRNIARILANLTFYNDLHADLVSAGWVGVLAKWLRSPDLALSLHAAKALANLDNDYGLGEKKYMDGIYLYHPQYRYSEPVYADVVFVHGLLGGPFRTWRQKDPKLNPKSPKAKEGLQPAEPDAPSVVDKPDSLGNPGDQAQGAPEGQNNVIVPSRDPYTFCWPRDWLAKDCPHVRMLTVEYETHLSEWSPKCPFESEKRSLAVRSAEIIKKLRVAGIGERPVIWVGHSMGGLLIKQMLVQCRDDPNMQKIIDQSRGVILYSVPHQGSPLAAYTNQTKYLLYPSVEVQELKQGSAMLVQLHDGFRELMFEEGIPLLSFGEGSKTHMPLNVKMLIVPPESSDPGFGEYHLMEELNHLEICKPVSREAPLYRLTLDFIRDCIPMNVVEHILRANMPEDFMFPDLDMES